MSKNNNNSNTSMFLYTALIFAVALILIIIAFFGQTNISNLRKSAQLADVPVAVTEAIPSETPAEEQNQDALAQLGNAVSSLEAENNNLKDELKTYQSLINAYLADDMEAAREELKDIAPDKLTDEQKKLYDKIEEKLNEREEQ